MQTNVHSYEVLQIFPHHYSLRSLAVSSCCGIVLVTTSLMFYPLMITLSFIYFGETRNSFISACCNNYPTALGFRRGCFFPPLVRTNLMQGGDVPSECRVLGVFKRKLIELRSRKHTQTVVDIQKGNKKEERKKNNKNAVISSSCICLLFCTSG